MFKSEFRVFIQLDAKQYLHLDPPKSFVDENKISLIKSDIELPMIIPVSGTYYDEVSFFQSGKVISIQIIKDKGENILVKYLCENQLQIELNHNQDVFNKLQTVLSFTRKYNYEFSDVDQMDWICSVLQRKYNST
jgi:hypothetical protein